MKEKQKLQKPSGSCILLSVVLIVAGCIFCYLEWFRGMHFGRRYDGLLGPILMMLGLLVFYRGMQGKEYRFWHKDWETLDEAAKEKRAEEMFICPYCENKLAKKDVYCPVCGRKL